MLTCSAFCEAKSYSENRKLRTDRNCFLLFFRCLFSVALPVFAKAKTGGEAGIRTPGTLTSTTDFESAALNRTRPPLRIRLVISSRLWLARGFLVEQNGIEPSTSAMRTRRSPKLSYCPKASLPSGPEPWSMSPGP